MKRSLDYDKLHPFMCHSALDSEPNSRAFLVYKLKWAMKEEPYYLGPCIASQTSTILLTFRQLASMHLGCIISLWENVRVSHCHPAPPLILLNLTIFNPRSDLSSSFDIPSKSLVKSLLFLLLLLVLWISSSDLANYRWSPSSTLIKVGLAFSPRW